jgi:antitoxin component YwqK of YwqJK toxin-antitoxin module
MLSIFLKSFLPLPLILGLYIQPAHSRPKEPQSVQIPRKVHRILPVGARLLSTKVGIIKDQKLEGVSDQETERRGGTYYLKGAETPYSGRIFALHSNGNREMEGTLKDGKWHGKTVLCYESGQKRIEENWNNGEAHGPWVEWHENGSKKKEGTIKKGKEDGIELLWHEDGKKQGRLDWKNGELDEDSEEWWNIKGEPVNSYVETLLPFNLADGVTWGDTQDREGLRYLNGSDTPYTGKLFNVYKNGVRSSELNYKDGKLHGPWITWHGRWKSSELNHKDNKAHGLFTMWHRNGQKQGEVIFKDDEKVSAQYWNSKGEPVDSEEESEK